MAAQGPKSSGQWMGLATLVVAAAVLVISVSNWRQISSLNSRLDPIEARLGAIAGKIGRANSNERPARPVNRNGPDPDKVYTIKTAGAPAEGPANAAVTIAEFSDFQ